MPSPKPTILVTGADGQVGNALLQSLTPLGQVVASTLTGVPLSVPTIAADLSQPDQVRELVRQVKPQVIINPAAHTAVDKAESEPNLAYALNEMAPLILAEEAKALGIPLIHYSTDYVFDGSGAHARSEEAPTGPLSVYGASKLAGEKAIQGTGAHAVIFRTSWVFSAHGHNFVKTMLRLGKEREELAIVGDQIGAPTQAEMLADMTTRALAQGFAEGFDKIAGLYHLCSAGETSWHGFAEEIFLQARSLGVTLAVKSLKPIPTAEYPTPARRPLNSRLDCRRFCRTFGQGKLPYWQESLRETLRALVTASPSS